MAKTDQTGRIPRLIWVFVGHTGQSVGFVMLWLIFLFRNVHIHDYLYNILEKECESQGLQFISELTRDLHVWPDYHGNRSPIADHTLKGMVKLQSELFLHVCKKEFKKRQATSWQNQQNDCVPSEDSDQSGDLPSLIRVFTVRSVGS